MKPHQWFAYGIGITSSIDLPLDVPKTGAANHTIKLIYY